MIDVGKRSFLGVRSKNNRTKYSAWLAQMAPNREQNKTKQNKKKQAHIFQLRAILKVHKKSLENCQNIICIRPKRALGNYS